MSYDQDPSTPDPRTSAIVDRLRAAGCVFAEDEARLLLEAAGSPAELESMVSRRVDGLPLEHILGWAEFCGLRIKVDTGVFVPRQRTELLVREAVRRAHERSESSKQTGQGSPPPVVVDLCCGSGAIGAAIAHSLATVDLYAADIDPAAVRSAHRNLDPIGGHVFEGDLFDPLPPQLHGRIDILAVNAPYVPSEAIATMPPEARLFEARVALDGGADGLDVHRRVAASAPRWLAPGGHLLVESSESQAPVVASIFADSGLIPTIVTSDELDSTVVAGTREAKGPHAGPQRSQRAGRDRRANK